MSATKLAIVEVLDRDGHARLIVPVSSWPITIGRSIECDVVLDDAHAAARHATVSSDGAEAGESAAGALTLSVGDTINGVVIGKKRIAAQQSVALNAGDILQIGNTRLRVRRASEALAAERPLLPEPRRQALPMIAMAAVLVVSSLAGQWLGSNTSARYIEYLPMVIGLPIVAFVWTGFWSIGSKLVQHRFDFWRHMRVLLGYSLISATVDTILPIAAFMTGVTLFSRIHPLVTIAWGCAIVLAHLVLIMPSYRRGLTVAMTALFVGGVSLLFVYTYQKQDRLFSQLYVTTLAPPAFRLAPAVETSTFLDEVRALKPVLDAHTKDDDGDSEGFGEY